MESQVSQKNDENKIKILEKLIKKEMQMGDFRQKMAKKAPLRGNR